MMNEADVLRDHPHVGDLCQTGMILAIELIRRNPANAIPGRNGAAGALFNTGSRTSAGRVSREAIAAATRD